MNKEQRVTVSVSNLGKQK